MKSGLAVVNQYLAKNQPQKAIKKFQELESLSPLDPELLELGLSVAYEVEDWKYALKLAENWLEVSFIASKTNGMKRLAPLKKP